MKSKVDNNPNISDPYMAYKQWCNLRMFCSRKCCKTLLSRGSRVTVYGQILSAFEWLWTFPMKFSNSSPVDNNRKRLTFYFPDTVYFSVDHYSFPFFVTWKSSSNFPFEWMTSGLATTTIFRPDFTACFRFWKSFPLLSHRFTLATCPLKICKEKFLKVFRSGYLEELSSNFQERFK